jgi:hypothetical protein
LILKLLHIINILTILLSTVGIASYSHYCKDELKTVSFFTNLIEPCCKEDRSKKSCENKFSAERCRSQENFCTNKNSTASTQKDYRKTSFKKRSCCLNQSDYSNVGLYTNLAIPELDVLLFSATLPTSLLKTPASIQIYTGYFNQIDYKFLCFYPPPNCPLYLAHQSFLC